MHAVPAERPFVNGARGERPFMQSGCAECHQVALPVEAAGSRRSILAFTDLLLHDLGDALADRDISGVFVPSLWRTAPLWGLNASVNSGQALRLLHDGRAEHRGGDSLA